MKPITVTVTDHETGDTETQELKDYVLVCGTHQLTHSVMHANGTVVLTLKPVSVSPTEEQSNG